MDMILLKPLYYGTDGVEVRTFPYLWDAAFQQQQAAVYQDLTPARNAANRNARGLRWGVLVNDSLHWTDKNTYRLPADLNSEEQGRVREMDLLPEPFLCLPQIERLVREVFAVYYGNAQQNEAYIVQLSAIRYQPTVSTTAYPPPDHPHQDGSDNAIIVLRKAPSIMGGMSRLYTLDEKPLYEVSLEAGQGLFVEDERYKHQVMPMLLDTGLRRPGEPDARDIMIVRIDPARR